MNNKYCLLSCVAVVVEQEVEEDRDGDDDDDDDHCGIYYTHTHAYVCIFYCVHVFYFEGVYLFCLRGAASPPLLLLC